MTPARWQQIEGLYLAARERDPAVRESFLAGACGDDEELRAKVESMLAQDGREDKILDIPAAGLLTEGCENTAIREGAQVGPYRVDALLGEGGMGRVYKAHDTRLKRSVAIKILNSRFEARFEREARAISALNHPHICTLYDVGTGYLVMELIEGETLASHLCKGALSLDLVQRYGAQIASAMAAAHGLGIVHRDLKPGNIMLGKNGVKVLDFGLARLSGPPRTDPKPDSLSDSQAVLGTPSYMAPEQLEGKPCDSRSDIFSLGLVLYEMATGKRAFSGDSQAALIANLLRCERPPLGGIPERLAHVIERCLNKDPEARWQSATDVKLELEWCAAPPANSAGAQNAVPTARRWLWPLVAALGIAATVVMAFVHFREVPPATRVVRSTILPPERTSFSFAAGFGPMALSPDGRRVVFAVTAEDGKSQLWIRPLDAETAQPLPGTEGGQFPFWSPDSRWVAFFADSKLKKIDTAGGPPVVLADAPQPHGGSWSNKGVIVFARDGGIYGLRRIPSRGGDTTAATAVSGDAGGRHQTPWFLPDGEHFLFAAYKPRAGFRKDVRVGSLGSTASRVIGETDANAAYSEGRLLYIFEGTLMAQPFDTISLRTAGEAVPVAERVASLFTGFFSVSGVGLLAYQTGADPNELQIAWFDRTGRATGTIGELRQVRAIELSPDRKTVAASLLNHSNPSLWLYDAARASPTRFTFDPPVDFEAVWSPDGQTIAFVSTRRGHNDLYTKPANGSAAEELLYEDELQKFPTSWSPDGKYLLYYADGGPQGADLFILPLIPERPGAPLKPVPFFQTRFNERYGQFSPDGRWVAYMSDESQVPEIYVAPFSRPGEKHQISPKGGTMPRWRRDGKEIFYLTVPGEQLMAAEVRISREMVEVSAVHTLFDGIPAHNFYLYDISADGQRILAAVPARSQKAPEPITLVQNWAELKK
jgi:Tol biopolymer transport system component/tRNA A-37 threonylcarbamoyl transferase component Bud32